MDIKDFLSAYEKGTVQISSNVTENQRDIIEKNYQMRSGKFVDSYFEDGETEKYYFNVVMGFCQSLIRGSKIRLSEFTLSSLNGKWMRLLQILKMGLKHFLKYTEFFDTKEDVLTELVEMGHVLTKVVDGETTIVDLRNFVFKPNIKTVKESGGAEKIFMSYEEAKGEYGDNDNWDEIEKYWDAIKKVETQLTFIEFWKEDEFDVKGEKIYTKGCIKYLDRSEFTPDEHQNATEWNPYLEVDRFDSPYEVPTANKREERVYGKTKRVFPYDEQRLIEIPGRYVGMGGYEICRPAQEDYNEKRNFKRKFDRIALRGILVHKIGNLRDSKDGEALTQEFLSRVDTGGAVKIFSDESLDRLNVGSTTNDTLAMTNDLFEFMRFMLGVTPIAIGDEGANKTAYYAMTQAQAQQTTYQVIRGKCARLFERLFQDFLLEDVIETIISNKVIPIYGDKEDVKEMDRFLAEQSVYRDESITSKEEAENAIGEKMKEAEQMGSTRFIEVDKNTTKKAFKKLFKELDFLAEFNLSEQAIDQNAKIKTLIETDGMENEKLRGIILDIVGVDPKVIELTDEEKEKKLEEEAVVANTMAQANNIPEVPLGVNQTGIDQPV